MKKLYQALLCRHGTVGGGNRQRGIRQDGFPDRLFRFTARTRHNKNRSILTTKTMTRSIITVRLANRKRRKILREGQVRIWMINASQPIW